MSRPVRVLVVDDSSVARLYVRQTLAALGRSGELHITEAADAAAAWAAVQATPPDCLVLDIDLPGLDGLSLLRELMQRQPVPVVVHSTLVRAGSALAVQALAIGAVSAVHKPVADGQRPVAQAQAELLAAVQAALSSKPRAVRAPVSAPSTAGHAVVSTGLCALGLSTGGVHALTQVLCDWPAAGPPLVVVQHMPAGFTSQLAVQLAERFSALDVAEATSGEPLRGGMVRIAPGERHLLVVRGPEGAQCQISDAAAVAWHRPSVDVLFDSLARLSGVPISAVLMTGMGEDGARGLLALRQAGARTAVQDEATSVVFGMPQAAWRLGAAQRQLGLGDVAAWLLGSA